MKKILAVLLALTMLMGCVLTFASCASKPKLNLEKAADALEDEDYSVEYDDDSDETGVKEMLYASDGENYLEMYKFESSTTAKLYYKSLKLAYDQKIENWKLQIKTYKHILSKYDDDIDEDDYKDMIEDLEERMKDYKKEYSFGRSGNIVWEGTADAVKDSRK